MWLIRLLKYLTNLIRQGEETAITFVSTVVPWIVPVVPAYLTYQHSVNSEDLNFPVIVALCVAGSVEFLGLTSMYRTFQFFEHNRRYKNATKKSPTWVPVLSYILYLVIVLTVNVVLDASHPPVDWSHVWAVGLLSILSVPAGVLLAVMAVHNERVLEHQKELAERKENRATSSRNRPEPVLEPAKSSGKPASQFREQIWGIFDREWYEKHSIAELSEIAAELKLNYPQSKSYLWSERKKWMTEHPEIQQ